MQVRSCLVDVAASMVAMPKWPHARCVDEEKEGGEEVVVPTSPHNPCKPYNR